jgi:hypothetical protein
MVFDHMGYIVGLQSYNWSELVREWNGDDIIGRLDDGLSFETIGIHVAHIWAMVDYIDSIETGSGAAARAVSRSYPYAEYRAAPRTWNGETIAP